MARRCKNCGAANSFGSRYCEECGSKLDASIDLSALKKKTDINVNVVFSILSVLVIAAVLFLTFNQKTVMAYTLDRYFRSLNKCDIAMFMDTFPKEVSDSLLNDDQKNDLSLLLIQSAMNENYSSFTKRYGNNFRIRYSVSVREYWTKNQISQAKDTLFDLWNISKPVIKDGMTFTIKVTYFGDLTDEAYISDIKMVKIRSKWYIYPDLNALMYLYR